MALIIQGAAIIVIAGDSPKFQQGILPTLGE